MMGIDKATLMYLFGFVLVIIGIGFFSSNVSATLCYSYTSSGSGGCNSTNGCVFKNETWGSWCEELSCWSFYDQSTCDTAEVTGKNCTWTAGGDSFYCTEPSCWAYSGTNESACLNNSAGRSCSWSASCYSTGGGGGGDTNCWDITDESSCTNSTGCNWGDCYDRSCWDYTDETECNAAKDPWDGRNCTFSNSVCKNDDCGDTILYNNITTCDVASHCSWTGSSDTGWCQGINCWYFDGNQTGCTGANNTNGIDCKWNSGYCQEDDCWNYDDDETVCGEKVECAWTAWESSGWCEEVNCWTWDTNHGGSEVACDGNGTLYGLTCNWINQSGGSGDGWCETDFSSTNCTTYNNEGQCYDSWYCWWQANDWSDPSLGGNCTDPDWSTVDDSDTILNAWNPGCYAFDSNQTECGYISGCDNNTAGSCDTNSTHENVNEINLNGMNCTMVNDSGLCNSIPALASCCSWQNGSCTENAFDSSCWNDLAQTNGGETSCEDASTKLNCNALAGSPWYWPCKWDNTTSPAKCSVKADDIWGNNTRSYVTIENNKLCEAVGGIWITENYCSGNVSVPTGRCEYKFDGETNCNKACFACEYKSDGNVHNGSANAEIACLASDLGYCEFTTDTGARNAFGTCRAKKEFVGGINGCSTTNCAGCTFMGVGNSSGQSGNGTRSAEDHCKDFPTACKWLSDASADTGGSCVDVDTQVCEDVCDRCYTVATCVNDGRSDITNLTGSCKWQGTDNAGNCVANVAGDVEICWNGEDDDDDGLFDCADPGCYADSFCGMVEGNCFVWSNSSDCNTDTDCQWVSDNWGGWCDFRGSQCWRNDGNVNSCRGVVNVTQEQINLTDLRYSANNLNDSVLFNLSNLGYGWVGGSVVITNESGGVLVGNYTVDYLEQTVNFSNTTFFVSGPGASINITNVSYQYNSSSGQYCEWQAGTGSGWCEQDWDIADDCFFGLNESNCFGLTAGDGQTCTWTNDTWCNGQGNGSDWCDGAGGWCDHPDFTFTDCWSNSDNTTCTDTSGCSWRADNYSQPHCEVNWSTSCWNEFDSSSCNAVSGCSWRTENGGAWCDSTLSGCWSNQDVTDCNAASADCTWVDYGGGGGTCEPSCFNTTAYSSQTSCEAITGCLWLAEVGWCEEQQAEKCFNSTNSGNQVNCEGTVGCDWRGAGWCNPVDGFNTGGTSGGGGTGGTSGECYKYDGNETQCTNKTVTGTACSWFSENNPWCEVDWSTDCWIYTVEGDCTVGNGCWWNPTDSYCTNLMEQCWMNSSLQGDATACDANANCNSTIWGSCEPSCFSYATEATCGTGCNWLNGWCNPSGMVDIFDGLETGAPTPLGFDACGTDSIAQQSADLCGFGMKDMGDAYGFGANVFNVENSSYCNKVKISAFVMDMSGGGGGGTGGPSATEKTGDGNDTVEFYVYLDADGITTGNCVVESDSTLVGFDFKFRYSSVWSPSTSKATETFTSYKCSSNDWVATDIKTSTWKQKMCGEIGGPMIAVEKGELARYPLLYSSTADLRVYVVTVGNTGDVNSPTDSAGPGYATPGAFDFSIDGAMDWGANSAQFESILQHGFVKYEDCYNSVDDDEDGNIDCSDWDCEFSSACTATGVNAAGFSDTTMPIMKGMKLEEYPDSAKIMFEVSKPVNGTLKFYGNDSTCLTLNASLDDIGIRSSNVRNYKMWQEIDIYNDGSVASLGSHLLNDTDYYYKLKFCDTDNRCSLSACSSFRTSSVSKCGFCDFVLKLKAPSGYTVSYDVDQDGTYDHEQGAVCGANAGYRVNYTQSRGMTIKLAKDDGTSYFEFVNVTATKSGLNDNVRTLTSADDSIIGTDSLVGLNANSRDKLVNNLHPEVCRIKIPSSGTCDTLTHCDDSGNNCVDRTSEATLIDSANCVWEVPFCEFSTYKEAADGGGDTGSGSGGGGGGLPSTVVCGDGDVEGNEECDDGNLLNGDGCSSICKDELDLSPPGEDSDSGSGVTGNAVDEAAGEEEGGTDEARGGGAGYLTWILGVVIVIAGIVVAIYFNNKKKQIRGY